MRPLNTAIAKRAVVLLNIPCSDTAVSLMAIAVRLVRKCPRAPAARQGLANPVLGDQVAVQVGLVVDHVATASDSAPDFWCSSHVEGLLNC